MSVRLRSAGPPEPWAAGPAPRLRLYSGADRAAVLEALAAGRESASGPARLAIIVNGPEDGPGRAEAARRWLAHEGPRPDGVAYRDAPLGGEIAFVFTNGSAAYPGMGAELALAFPELAEEFEASHARLRPRAGEAPGRPGPARGHRPDSRGRGALRLPRGVHPWPAADPAGCRDRILLR